MLTNQQSSDKIRMSRLFYIMPISYHLPLAAPAMQGGTFLFGLSGIPQNKKGVAGTQNRHKKQGGLFPLLFIAPGLLPVLHLSEASPAEPPARWRCSPHSWNSARRGHPRFFPEERWRGRRERKTFQNSTL